MTLGRQLQKELKKNDTPQKCITVSYCSIDIIFGNLWHIYLFSFYSVGLTFFLSLGLARRATLSSELIAAAW
jgi:hypothetical protein